MTAPGADEVYREYPELMEQLVIACRPLVLLPLPEMAAANERMQTLAPFFAAPLAYHDGGPQPDRSAPRHQRRRRPAARVLLDLAPEPANT